MSNSQMTNHGDARQNLGTGNSALIGHWGLSIGHSFRAPSWLIIPSIPQLIRQALEIFPDFPLVPWWNDRVGRACRFHFPRAVAAEGVFAVRRLALAVGAAGLLGVAAGLLAALAHLRQAAVQADVL